MKKSLITRATSIFTRQKSVKEASNHIGEGQGYGRYGASRERKSLAGWVSSLGSATEDIERNITKLRERSRDLFMGSPIASGALRTMVTNVVGPGLRLNSSIDADFLNLSKEEADAWETHVEREFALWSESKACDITRMNDFYELQALAFLSMYS